MVRVSDLKQYDIIIRCQIKDGRFIKRHIGYVTHHDSALVSVDKATLWSTLDYSCPVNMSRINQTFIFKSDAQRDVSHYYTTPTPEELKQGKALLVTKRLKQ